MVAWLQCALVIATALIWRFAPTWVGAIAAVVTIGAAAYFGRACPRSARKAWLPLALVVAAIAALPLIGQWPCDTACRGAAAFSRVLGMPSHCFAIVSALVMALLAASTRTRLAAGFSWLMAGGSIYYLVLAWRLSLECPSCFAVHTAVLSLACMTSGALRLKKRVLLVVIGALVMHAVIAPGAFAGQDPGTTLSNDELQIVDKIDQNRRRGRADAPLTVELLIDFACPTCSEHYEQLLEAIDPALKEGRVLLVTRLRAQRYDKTAQQLQKWAYAAAQQSATTWSTFVVTMLGSKPGTDIEQLRKQAGQMVNIKTLDSIARGYQAAIAQVAKLDDERLKKLQAGLQTPQIFLLHSRGGAVIEHWQGSFEVAAVTEAIAKAR